jgi:hypothetical protein
VEKAHAHTDTHTTEDNNTLKAACADKKHTNTHRYTHNMHRKYLKSSINGAGTRGGIGALDLVSLRMHLHASDKEMT